LAWINGLVWFQNRPKTKPAASRWAKLVTVPANPLVLAGLARPVVSNIRFMFSGISIDGRVQISYGYVQNINIGTSLSFLVLLAAIIINIIRQMLLGTS
jgi:hypothetical protein